MLSRIKPVVRRHHTLLAALVVILLAWLGASGRYACLMPGRALQLQCTVNSHTGLAHMTRGMNTETIAALDAAATEEDIPLLQEMLFSEDRVTAMTAAEVLQKKGKKGLRALKDAYAEAEARKDPSRAALIDEYGDLGEK